MRRALALNPLPIRPSTHSIPRSRHYLCSLLTTHPPAFRLVLCEHLLSRLWRLPLRPRRLLSSRRQDALYSVHQCLRSAGIVGIAFSQRRKGVLVAMVRTRALRSCARGYSMAAFHLSLPACGNSPYSAESFVPCDVRRRPGTHLGLAAILWLLFPLRSGCWSFQRRCQDNGGPLRFGRHYRGFGRNLRCAAGQCRAVS